MKIFALNDCDWVIGESLETCVEFYCGFISEEEMEDDKHELSDAELDSLKFHDFDESGVTVIRTFREQLAIEIAAGGEFPRIFCFY
jgi:hypothetical protein